MDKKSKVISGLKTGKIIIQKPNKYFTDSEKHHIIQELLSSGCTKREIWEKIYRTRRRTRAITSLDETIGL
jgi:hypothetical protein